MLNTIAHYGMFLRWLLNRIGIRNFYENSVTAMTEKVTENKKRTFAMIKRFLLWLVYLHILSGSVFVGHVDAVQPIGTLGEGYLRQIQFLPDGTILRVLLNHLEIIDTENDVILARFAEQPELIWRVIVSSDGRLAAIRTEKTAQLWDIVVRKKLHQWELGNFGGWSPEVLDVPFLAAFSETDSLLAINNGHEQITLWNSEDG